jgi:predicted peptidase
MNLFRPGFAPQFGQLAVIFSLLLLPMGGCSSTMVASSTEHFPGETGFIETHITIDNQPHTVWVFIPRNYDSNHRYPTILFLHGLFEKGTHGEKVLAAGLGPVIAQTPEQWPFITIFPQSPDNWIGLDKDRIAIGSLDAVQRKWNVDPDRVILAGLSYGGLGTWEIGARHADRFAALVPVSALKSDMSIAKLRNTPIWAFASKDDPWVKASSSTEMCQELLAMGGKPRLTQFQGMSHDCWAEAVSDSDLIQWMLLQHRTPQQLQPTQTAQARGLVFSSAVGEQ